MSPALTPVPAPTQVRELLGDLLGRPVEVGPAEPLTPEADRATTVAVFVDKSLTLRLVAVADLPFSAYAGASIGLLAVGRAETAIADGTLSATLEENLREVFRTCGSLLNDDGLPHVRLHAVHHVGSVPPPQAHAAACAVGRRLDLEVAISGYGTGRLSLVGMP